MNGDPAWQVEWELLAILMSLHVFRSKLVAALSAAVELSSPTVLINAHATEIALVLDELSAELTLTQHVQGVLKFDADFLSRLSQ